jgi:hypothetical protein
MRIIYPQAPQMIEKSGTLLFTAALVYSGMRTRLEVHQQGIDFAIVTYAPLCPTLGPAAAIFVPNLAKMSSSFSTTPLLSTPTISVR